MRFHMVSQQGWEGMTRTEASLIAGNFPPLSLLLLWHSLLSAFLHHYSCFSPHSCSLSLLHIGEDPNFLAREMREAVQKGMFPKWKMFIQVMKEEDGYKHNFAFDCTKVPPFSPSFPIFLNPIPLSLKYKI